MRTTHIFIKTTNTRSSLKPTNNSTIIFLLYLLSIIFCFYFNSFYLITTIIITQPSKQQLLIFVCLTNSNLINSLFSKLVSFSTNKKTNITVIFFFQKLSTPKINLFQQKTTNQSISQLTPFKNFSLSLKKKKSKCSNCSISPTLKLLFVMAYQQSIPSTQHRVMFLNNLTTLQLFASQQI